MERYFHFYKEHKKQKFQMYHLAPEEGTVNEQAPPPQQRSLKERNNCFVQQMNKKPKMVVVWKSSQKRGRPSLGLKQQLP